MTVKDLANGIGMSMSTTCQKTKRFMIAINKALPLELPKTEEELCEVTIDWNSKSSAVRACFGCVGAINGWLCCMNKPRVHNAAHHCSGHCQRHGIDVQAVVDSNLQFLHFGIVGPG